jgi:hypothetical protein
VALVIAAVVAAVAAPKVWWVFVIAFVPLGLYTAAFCRVDVTVDDIAVTIRYGLTRWPVQRVTLDRVRRVQAIDLQPIEWGGWGYRGSLRLRKKAAVVLRKGPALRLELDEDFVELAITVDDPAGAVAAITAVLSSG